jgi:hypothetical protein
MKSLLVGVCCLALAAPLGAQSPRRSVPAKDAAIHTVGHFGKAPCAEDCAPHKVCVPESTTIKKPRVVFSMKCVEYCLPKCSLHARGCDKCDNCDADCGPPRTKRVLMKKVVVDECPGTICVLKPAPACVHGAGCVPGERIPAMPRTIDKR